MKLSSIIVLALTTSCASAFSPVYSKIQGNSSLKSKTSLKALFFADETIAVSESIKENDEDEIESMVGSVGNDILSMSGTIYDKLGFAEDQIALGIKPEDVSVF